MTIKEIIFYGILMVGVIYTFWESIKEAKERSRSNEYETDFSNLSSSEFKEFCASLFRNMGYMCRTMSNTNNGYDIYMEKDGVSYIVKCKMCSDTVGRPLLQKLVGVNMAKKADKCLFITTSTFSKPAKDYAKEQRILLIDGDYLQRLI